MLLSRPSAAAAASDAHTLHAVAFWLRSWTAFGAISLLASVFVEAEAFSRDATIFPGQCHKFLTCALLIAVRQVACQVVRANALDALAVSFIDTALLKIP